MSTNILLKITRSKLQDVPSSHPKRPDVEEYLSSDGSYLLQLRKDSEIRFGPPFYRAAIYSGDGKLVLDFGDKRFFSYAESEHGFANWPGPWSPNSPQVPLIELLNANPGSGIKIARMNVFDAAHKKPLVTWDFESLVSHRMWSLDGCLYLFRDVGTIYVFKIDTGNLVSVSISRSPHFFLLQNRFVCVIGRTGRVEIVEATSGKMLATDHIPEDGFEVKHAFLDEMRNTVSVTLKCPTDPDIQNVCYTISIHT